LPPDRSLIGIHNAWDTVTHVVVADVNLDDAKKKM